MLVASDIYQIALDSSAQIVHTLTTIGKKRDIFAGSLFNRLSVDS
jgi:hypothetical protein